MYKSFTCGRCGRPVSQDATRCPHCGVLFSGVRTVTVPPTPSRQASKSDSRIGACLLGLVGVAVIVIVALALAGPFLAQNLGAMTTRLAPTDPLMGMATGAVAIKPSTATSQPALPTLKPSPLPRTAAPTRTPRPATATPPLPSATPMPEYRQGQLVDLLESGDIAIQVNGSGINDLSISIENLGDQPLEIEIPSGTYFASSAAGVQNMVIRDSRTAQVDVGDLVDLLLDAACANMERDVPSRDNQFTISKGSEDLVSLMAILEQENTPYIVAQAATWIVTNNASYADLGTLVSGTSQRRVIGAQEAALAMRLVDQAGIDITHRRIWADREKIAAGASPELAAWIRNR